MFFILEPDRIVCSLSRRTVKIGSTTKNFLHKIRARSQTQDRPGSCDEASVLSSSEKLHSNGCSVSGVTSSDPGEREAGASQGKPVSTWSEHVWSTFIHRGYSDDVTERPDVVVGKGRIQGS